MSHHYADRETCAKCGWIGYFLETHRCPPRPLPGPPPAGFDFFTGESLPRSQSKSEQRRLTAQLKELRDELAEARRLLKKALGCLIPADDEADQLDDEIRAFLERSKP